MSTRAATLDAREPVDLATLDMPDDQDWTASDAHAVQLDGLERASHDDEPRDGPHGAAAAAPAASGDELLFIIESVKRIETLLAQRHGATGRGLHTKVDSVREALPADLVKQLRWIATMRNKTMHEEGFFPKDMPGLRRAMLDCTLRLEQSGDAPEPPGVAPESRGGAAAPDAAPLSGERAAEPSAKRARAPRTSEPASQDSDAQAPEPAAAGEPKKPSAAAAKRDARAAADAAVAFRRLLLGLTVCTAIALAIALL